MTAKAKPVNTERAKRVPAAEVPEVQTLASIEEELTVLKADYPDVFARLRDLSERYNAALEDAEKAVRTREVSCGPFENFSTSVVYDPQKMYDELGRDLFFELGGTTEQQTIYTIDKTRVEAAVAAKKIAEESLDEFRKVQRSYRKPKPIILP